MREELARDMKSMVADVRQGLGILAQQQLSAMQQLQAFVCATAPPQPSAAAPPATPAAQQPPAAVPPTMATAPQPPSPQPPAATPPAPPTAPMPLAAVPPPAATAPQPSAATAPTPLGAQTVAAKPLWTGDTSEEESPATPSEFRYVSPNQEDEPLWSAAFPEHRSEPQVGADMVGPKASAGKPQVAGGGLRVSAVEAASTGAAELEVIGVPALQAAFRPTEPAAPPPTLQHSESGGSDEREARASPGPESDGTAFVFDGRGVFHEGHWYGFQWCPVCLQTQRISPQFCVGCKALSEATSTRARRPEPARTPTTIASTSSSAHTSGRHRNASSPRLA